MIYSSTATLGMPPCASSAPESSRSCKSSSSSGSGSSGSRSSGRIRTTLVAGAIALAACSTTTSDAFAFAPPVRGRGSMLFPAGISGNNRAGAVSTRSGADLGVRSARWTGGEIWGPVGIAKPVLQGRRKRWRGDGRGAGSVQMGSSLEAGLGEIFKAPDERILKAVEKAGNRAVPSDVAALAGVDLSVAKTGLVNLANLVGGDIEVSKDGDVVYNFPSNFRASLLQKSAYRRVVEAVRVAWPVLFYGIRVSFGVVLLASIVLIFTTIFFAATYASSSSSSDDRDNRRGRGGGGFGGGGGGMGFNTYFGPSPFDFFYFRPYYGYYNTPMMSRGDPEEMGLLESIFSYIFGDGNPNADIEQRRVEAAAALIRSNGGAVSAEQLAPLLSPGNPRPDDSRVDESFVLPILMALDGAPEVTEDGDIVYVFPTLQTSAMAGGVARALDTGVDERKEAARLEGLKSLSTADLRVSLEAAGIRAKAMYERSELVNAAMRRGINKLSDGRIVLEPRTTARAPAAGGGTGSARGPVIPEPLEEAERPFSVAAQWKKIAAGVLGVVNLGGAVYLQGLLSGPAFVGVTLPGYYGVVQAALPFLLTYATALNVIPAVRWLSNKRENAKIEERNEARRQWTKVGKRGGGAVDRKLKAARSMTKTLKVIKTDDVEYTTAKSLTDQNINADDDLLDEFDVRLGSPKQD